MEEFIKYLLDWESTIIGFIAGFLVLLLFVFYEKWQQSKSSNNSKINYAIPMFLIIVLCVSSLLILQFF